MLRITGQTERQRRSREQAEREAEMRSMSYRPVHPDIIRRNAVERRRDACRAKLEQVRQEYAGKRRSEDSLIAEAAYRMGRDEDEFRALIAETNDEDHQL